MRRTTVCALCLLASLVCSASAQRSKTSEDIGTREVRGIVTDASGKPVDKAVVQLKDTRSLQIRSFITDTDGAYHFAGLSTNVDYQLKAQHEGHVSSTKTLSVFSSKKIATIHLKLKRS